MKKKKSIYNGKIRYFDVFIKKIENFENFNGYIYI